VPHVAFATVPELREDPLTGDQVILAPGRARRPDTHRGAAPTRDVSPRVGSCPFCPGNEHQTPPEVQRTGSGAPDTPGWRVRVVPNLYPIVGGSVPGAHEVVVLSPDHATPFGRLHDDAAAEVFAVLRERAAHHLAAGLAHAQPFVNCGKAAGASIEHPHAQLIALGFVPPNVEHAVQRFARRGHDLVALAIDDALDGTHGVLQGSALAWCAPASLSPYEVLVAHPASSARFDHAPDQEVAAVAHATRRAVAAISEVLDDPPYNIVVHTAPATERRHFHWYVRVSPRLGVAAGFEQGTGLFVNTVPPEMAAAELREAAG
jgi:UDPglucose--hexose-1-phosphate uridylyltransferase